MGSLLGAVGLSLLLLASGDPVQRAAARLLGSTVLYPLREALVVAPRMLELWRENRRLRERLAAVHWERSRLRLLEEENRRLRELLALTRSSPESLLLGLVVSYETTPLGDLLVCNRGSADGVLPGTPVLVHGALLGTVVESWPGGARCRTLWHRDTRVSARVGWEGPRGILEGDPDIAPLLRLSGVPLGEPVAAGDTVYTSGLGRLFPRGIPVGIVERVRPDSLASLQRIRVRPLVDRSRIRDVFLLLQHAGEGAPR
jgi:rod shape-determining protein MreC